MRVSITNIASKAGVSVATVSRVINSSGYVNKQTRQKVLDALAELNYRPNLVARSLATRQSNTIGLMIPHIASVFFSSFAAAVEERADDLGYNVILTHTREDSVREAKCLDMLINRQVDGIIATPVGHGINYFVDVADRLPIVFAARKIDNIGISSVTVDNLAGSYRVVNHLIKQGFRDIGIITGPTVISTGRDRWLGAKRAMEENGLVIDPQFVKEGDFTAEAGYRLMLELLDSPVRPSAVYTANHMTLVGVLKALREQGLTVPGQMEVASFEGFHDTVFDYLVVPKLTANFHPTREMALSAVNILVEQIQAVKAGSDYISKDVVLNTKLDC